jgi:hypothetical protein
MSDNMLKDAPNRYPVTFPATRRNRPSCPASRMETTSVERPLTGEGHPVAATAPATGECGVKPAPAFLEAAPEGSAQPVDLRRDLAEMATLKRRTWKPRDASHSALP